MYRIYVNFTNEYYVLKCSRPVWMELWASGRRGWNAGALGSLPPNPFCGSMGSACSSHLEKQREKTVTEEEKQNLLRFFGVFLHNKVLAEQ